MELLSPAGSFESLKAAVLNGANAVYFGGCVFNARIRAVNFTQDDLISAIDYCHERDVRAYITLNTLIFDREIPDLLSYAKFLYEHGADSVIVQDLGVVSLLKRYLPEFPIHASTQMGISSLNGVLECERLGISQVVLSREMPMSEIEFISQNTSVPLECFVHGAMCVCFSGACLFSSMVGKRSGNRGACAQPCRKQMSFLGQPSSNDLNLSMADMCMIEHIDELKKAHVASLKIEGRMKKPEYIACVTHAYRRALDGAFPEEIAQLKREMFEVFNRGEFTTGYYFGDNTRTDRIGAAMPSDTLVATLHERCRGDVHVRKASMSLELIPNCQAVLKINCDDFSFELLGDVCTEALKPITKETVCRYVDALKKFGDTPYIVGDIDVAVQNAYLPISAVNQMRREAISRLNETFHVRKSASTIDCTRSAFKGTIREKPQVSVRVMSIYQAVLACQTGANEIILDAQTCDLTDLSELNPYRSDIALILALPTAIIGQQNRVYYEKLIKDATKNHIFDAIEVNNLGQVSLCGATPIYGGAALNVTNTHSAKLLLSIGIVRLTLSHELNAAQCRDIIRQLPVGSTALNVYGRTVLMTLFHCPVREHIGCKKCTLNNTATDESSRIFPLISEHKSIAKPCMSVRILNCHPTDIIAQALLQGIQPTAYILNFSDEQQDIICQRVSSALKAANHEPTLPLKNTTRGYWNT